MEKKSDQSKITVYFPVNDATKFNEIQRDGLQAHVASFFLNPPRNSERFVGYTVNLDECNVYNAEYRNDWEKYDKTKLPLAYYLANKQTHDFGNNAEVLISIPEGRIPPEKLKFYENSLTTYYN